MKIKWGNSIKIIIYLISFIIFLLLVKKIVDIYQYHHRLNYIEKAPTIQKLDVVFGSDSAQNTMFLYGSYTCEYCRRFFKEVYPQFYNDYIKTKKIKLVWKIVEFNKNEKLLQAFKTVLCIHAFGNFEKLHELLLEEPNVIYLPEFEEMINHFIESDALVAECILNDETESYLLDNIKEFHNFGFKGTPTFILGNNYLTSFLPFKEFKNWVNKNMH